MDLGECPKIHDLALRADYEKASQSKDYYYDIDVSRRRVILSSALFIFLSGSSDQCGRKGMRPYTLSITNKMQCYTIFFITVNALRVSGGFSAHHQELKTVYTASGVCTRCAVLSS
jgi:hypothetical protein